MTVGKDQGIGIAIILTIISFPKFIYPGYLSSLTSMSGIKVVIKHIPLPFSSISRMLNKELADLKQRYQDEHDRTIQERIRQDYESLEMFISELAASQSKIYDFQMHVMITANTQEELDTKKLQVKNYLEAMEMQAIPLRFEQEKVFYGRKQLIYDTVEKLIDYKEKEDHSSISLHYQQYTSSGMFL